MELSEFFVDVMARNVEQVQKALEGMTEADLRVTPDPEKVNPAGWLVWHQSRFADMTFSTVGETTQAWVEGNWSEKFPGTPPDPQKTGLDDTMAQVMAVNFSKEALTGYLDAVFEKAKAVASGLTPEDFDREMPSPVHPERPPRKLGYIFAGCVTDFVHHSGQVCYLRGFVTGPGWR